MRRPVANNKKRLSWKRIQWTWLKGHWLKLAWAASGSVLIVAVAGIAFVIQLRDPPIAIEPFTLGAGSDAAGLSAAALADETKAQISKIYARSGGLFQQRKLGDGTLALDVTIGKSGWNFQTLAKAFHIPLTAADVSARVFEDKQGLVLNWTTVTQNQRITVDTRTIPRPSASKGAEQPTEDEAAESKDFSAKVDAALECVALKTVALISPDVAATYLHTQDESQGTNTVANDGQAPRCIDHDDVALYSEITKDATASAASRVNSYVGLSVHYASTRQFFEELNMAKGGAKFALQEIPCDDDPQLLSAWQRFKCAVLFKARAKNKQAQVAVHMQLGNAYSDYASVAKTIRQEHAERRRAIAAYDHVIAIDSHYAPAYNAKGLQLSLLGDTLGAEKAYQASLASKATPAAYLDFGMLNIGRDDLYADRDFRPGDLKAAEQHFQLAVDLDPEYWDAHSNLGFVLYQRRHYRQAIDVLEPAVEHDEYNRDLRRLLASAYARLCQFSAAKAHFTKEYRRVADPNKKSTYDKEAAVNTLADWGWTLDRFGFRAAAIDQETEVLTINPNHVDAMRFRGQMKLWDEETRADAVNDLSSAVDLDSAKTDVVLADYLAGLIRAGRSSDAVARYQEWSRVGLVPPLAPALTDDAEILPPNHRARLSYVNALLGERNLESAVYELEVLLRLGMPPGVNQIADMRALSTDIKAGPILQQRIDTLSKSMTADKATEWPKNECSIPELPPTVALVSVAIH
jgi:tetratricopeptide (TPR) repeat protein